MSCRDFKPQKRLMFGYILLIGVFGCILLVKFCINILFLVFISIFSLALAFL